MCGLGDVGGIGRKEGALEGEGYCAFMAESLQDLVRVLKSVGLIACDLVSWFFTF